MSITAIIVSLRPAPCPRQNEEPRPQPPRGGPRPGFAEAHAPRTLPSIRPFKPHPLSFRSRTAAPAAQKQPKISPIDHVVIIKVSRAIGTPLPQ